MNRYLSNVLVLACVMPLAINANDITSHTFFSVRPQWQSAMPEKSSFFHNRILDDNCGALEIAVLGGRSRKSGKLTRFFLPFGDCELRVAEAQFNAETGLPFLNSQQKGANVIAQNLNIATELGTFASIVRFEPRQDVFIIGVAYKQNLTKRLWFEASTPLERVRNTMGIRETVINNGGGVLVDSADVPVIGLDNSPVVANALQAFNQPNWLYGRISPGSLEKWGLADIELKLGLDHIFFHKDQCRRSSYGGFIIPTGKKPNGRYVFEPIVGHNRHFGVMWGQNASFNLGRKFGFDVDIEVDTVAKYFFANTQRRSIDPIDKQFGRYLALYANPAQATEAFNTANRLIGISGINAFTQCVKVKPFGSINLNSAIVIQRCWFASEFGTNMWARQGEKIFLKRREFPSTVAIKDILGQGVTNPAREINTIQPNLLSEVLAVNPVTLYSPLTRRDLDLTSAAHPTVISHIIYATVGTKADWGFINLGGSYEHDHLNLGLNRWLAWSKVGITF